MRADPIAMNKRLAERWLKKAEENRKISVHYPVDDALEWCAKELLRETEGFDRANQWVSAEEYGQEHGVTPQSVRNWARNGELEAMKTEGGSWLIHSKAKRRKSA